MDSKAEYSALSSTHSQKKKLKLEIWGRAQHEAARRPKSDWKYNLWG